MPGPEPPAATSPMRSAPAGRSSEVHEPRSIDPWFLAQIEDLVREERAHRGRRPRRRSTQARLRDAEAQGLLRQPPRAARRHRREGDARAPPRARHAAGVTSAWTPAPPSSPPRPPTSTRPTRRSARRSPTDRPQDHDPRRRPEPHRPGHRVRLLLRARRARAARGRVRDHHGQLQPGDRLDRLRHLGPPVLRAADARGRAWRSCDVEKPMGVIVQYGGQTPLKLRRGARGSRRADHRHHARIRSTSPRTASASRSWSTQLGLRQPPNAHRAHRGRRRCSSPREVGYPAGGAAVVRARRPRDGDRVQRGRPARLHDRRGAGVERQPGAARPLPRPRDRGRRRCRSATARTC